VPARNVTGKVRRMDDSHDSSPDKAPGRGQVLRFPRALAAPPENGAEPSVGELFAVLWLSLAEILGTAATATLLRRAARSAARRWPELSGLSISREGLDYEYAVPPAWREPGLAQLDTLRDLALELRTLLIDLTGTIVVNRLAEVPDLRERGIALPREGTP
jgi:hypothetical protein